LLVQHDIAIASASELRHVWGAATVQATKHLLSQPSHQHPQVKQAVKKGPCWKRTIGVQMLPAPLDFPGT
jgi:hypothetical protein